jgi:selenocysteine lyase/cysteine desulfurase
MPAVSVAVGLIAASLQPGDEVVVADDEFRSVLFPLLASAQSRATTIRRVPFASIADAVSPSTKLVATSFVRSNGGSVQNMVAVSSAARANGARVLVDATHGAGVLPFDAQGLGLDYVVAAAYKHLLCPRGVAFLRIAEDAWDQVSPLLSSWRSAAEPYTSFYGGTLADLAADASRFDVSLAWHPWVGARESLDFIARIDPEERRSWCVGLADALAAALGLEPSGSSILAVPVRCQLPEVKRCLEEASIVASYPAGIVRFSFHAYNTLDDVGRVAEVLGPLRG